MRFFELLKADSASRAEFLEAYKVLRGFPRSDFSIADKLKLESDLDNHTSHIDVSGAIVETREHPNLIRVLRIVCGEMNIPVTCFHGSKNRDFIQKLVAKEEFASSVSLINLNCEDLTGPQYNGLLMSEKFWSNLPSSRKVLIFQTDSTICKRSRDALKKFLSFDYIGSWIPQPRPIGITIDGGNGGLSMRDRLLSIRAIRSGVPARWPGAEDEYFATHIQAIGGKVASEVEQSLFSAQSKLVGTPFGSHNPGGLRRSEFVRLLFQCPSAIFIHRGRIGRLLGISN